MITSLTNPAVKQARKLGRRSGRTGASEQVLVEGPRAVREAIGFMDRLFVAGSAEAHAEILALAEAAGVEVIPVTDAVLSALTTAPSHQGLAGVATLAAAPLLETVAAAGFLVVLDRVADPGNLGTAVRSADAAGADAVVLSAGSVDPRSTKAVRASAGSMFHLPLVTGAAPADVVAACRTRGLHVVAADARAARAHTAAHLGGRVALLFGSEAHGLAPSLRSGADEVVGIPIFGAAESLNLAAAVAILCYESTRQRRSAAPAGLGAVEHTP